MTLHSTAETADRTETDNQKNTKDPTVEHPGPVVRIRPNGIRHFSDRADATFCLVTNADSIDLFEIEEADGYAGRMKVGLKPNQTLPELLATEIPDRAHILLVSPGVFIQSPLPEELGARRKLIAMPCNSTPTDLAAIRHFMEVVEQSDPEREEQDVARFFDRASAAKSLTFIDEEYDTHARFEHMDDSYEWNQQAGPIGWGEQQIAPSGELSVFPGSIMEFDSEVTLAINGTIALRGPTALHSGAPSFLHQDRARLHDALKTLQSDAVILTVDDGRIREITASHPRAEPAASALRAMIEIDSRYATIVECGFGINSALSLLDGNYGMNEPYGGANGCSHWGLGLTPWTQYALIALSLGTKVVTDDGDVLIGPGSPRQQRLQQHPTQDRESRKMRVRKGACGCHPG